LDIVRSLVRRGAYRDRLRCGGIPVVENADGSLDGLEAVIDKDRGRLLRGASLRRRIRRVDRLKKVAINFNRPISAGSTV